MSHTYVALGDSMSIDDYAGGAGRGAGSLLCRNQDGDFPDMSGRDLSRLGYSGQVLASDGAVAADVLERQLPRLAAPPALVTVTMGGNDLLSAYGDDDRALAAIARVEHQGDAVVRRLTQAGVRVIITTVYDPSDGTGAVPGLAAWSTGPTHIRTLNTRLSAVADRYGAATADVHQAFLGHGATAGDVSAPEARPDNRDLFLCGVVEPNAWGADVIRRTWWNALERHGWLDAIT